MAKAQTQVEQASASVAQVREEFNLTIVKAPFSGQVLKIKTYPGESVVQEEGIVELARTREMMAIAEVYESDISRVRLGQKASITSENATFPGKLYGKVQQIGLALVKPATFLLDSGSRRNCGCWWQLQVLLLPMS